MRAAFALALQRVTRVSSSAVREDLRAKARGDGEHGLKAVLNLTPLKCASGSKTRHSARPAAAPTSRRAAANPVRHGSSRHTQTPHNTRGTCTTRACVPTMPIPSRCCDPVPFFALSPPRSAISVPVPADLAVECSFLVAATQRHQRARSLELICQWTGRLSLPGGGPLSRSPQRSSRLRGHIGPQSPRAIMAWRWVDVTCEHQ